MHYAIVDRVSNLDVSLKLFLEFFPPWILFLATDLWYDRCRITIVAINVYIALYALMFKIMARLVFKYGSLALCKGFRTTPKSPSCFEALLI